MEEYTYRYIQYIIIPIQLSEAISLIPEEYRAFLLPSRPLIWAIQ